MLGRFRYLMSDFFPDLQRLSFRELVRKLADVCPPSIVRPSHEDWTRCEEYLGVTIPESYKFVLSLFGEGVFGSEAYFRSPTSQFAKLDSSEILETHFQYKKGGFPAHVYPDDGGMMQVGGVGNRSYTVWLDNLHRLGSSVNDEASKQCSIAIVDFSFNEIHRLRMPFDEFLYRLYKPKHHLLNSQLARGLSSFMFPSRKEPFFTRAHVVNESGWLDYTTN